MRAEITIPPLIIYEIKLAPPWFYAATNDQMSLQHCLIVFFVCKMEE